MYILKFITNIGKDVKINRKIYNIKYSEIVMTAREDLKILLVKEHLTLTELARLASNELDKKYTVQSLSQKLVRGTIPYDELEKLVAILGYSIRFEKI